VPVRIDGAGQQPIINNKLGFSTLFDLIIIAVTLAIIHAPRPKNPRASASNSSTAQVIHEIIVPRDRRAGATDDADETQ
jgi:hypothetical protein